MKKFFSTLLLMGSLITVNAVEKDLELGQQQWLKDLKVLVSLNSNKVDELAGVDKNNNGVRDDVENYILSKYSHDRFQRDMFFKAARKIQEIIALPLNGVIDEHIRLDRELLGIYTCRDYILYRNESKDLEKELMNKTLFKAKVLNTPQRLKSYIEHKKVLPMNFDKLTEQELLKDKNSCLALYYSYKNVEQKSTTLIIK
jgi:hypothetical protein